MRMRVMIPAGALGLVMLTGVLTSCRSQPLPAGAGGLVIFRQPTFKFILPDARPPEGSITDRLAIQASPGEIEPVAFAVVPQRAIANATVQVGDLKGPEGAVIPAGAVDARVVQVWKQKAIRGKEGETVTVPEALLKTDSLDFLDRQWSMDNLPSCPPDAPVCTKLETNQTKAFFLIVSVPAEAIPGEYSGEVKVGDPADPAKLTLAVNVLPFKLRGPGYTIGMYYNDNISATTPLEVYRQRLGVLRSLGVSSLRLMANRETMEQELKEVKAAGFEGPIIEYDPASFFGPEGLSNMKDYVATMKGVGYEPYLYGVDEPNVPNVPPREQHSMNGQIAAYKRIKQVGGLCSTALSVITDKVLAQQESQPLDFPLYSLHVKPDLGFRGYVSDIEFSAANKRHKLEGYYFNCTSENPRRNRLLVGFHLPTTHMEAAFGWTFYSYHQKAVPVPFDDFALEPNKKRWMMVFPTKEGCLPTMQSEAFREGVDDLRYLNTFLQLAKEKEQETTPATVEALRKQVMTEVARYKDMGDDVPFDTTANQFPEEQFDQSRAVIIEAILKLQAIKPGG